MCRFPVPGRLSFLLPALLLGFAQIFLLGSQPAQGWGWSGRLVPSTADGTPLPSNVIWNTGYLPMDGTMTGLGAAGGQSILTFPYFQYSPSPVGGTWMYEGTSVPCYSDDFDEPPAISALAQCCVWDDGTGDDPGPLQAISDYAQGSASVSLSACFVWQTSYSSPTDDPPPASLPPPPPPAVATFLIRTSLLAQHSLPSLSLSASANVRDQYGDQVVLNVEDPASTKSGGGSHLVQASKQMVGDKAVYTVNLVGTLDAFAANDHSYSGGAGGYAKLDAGVKPDYRTLTLHRDDELVRGETQDADGTTHGDTLYSYMDYSATYNPAVLNWQTFIPHFDGGWSMKTVLVSFEEGGSEQIPNITWSWSPNESEDDWNFGKWSMPFGNWAILADGPWMEIASSSLIPSAETLTYAAIDLADNTTRTAKYVMTFHYPAENWALSGAAVFGPDRVLSDPSNSTSPNTSPATMNFDYQADSYDINDLLKSGGMIASAAAPSLVVLTDAATDGAGGIAVGSLLGAAGYAAGTYTLDAKSSVPVNTSEAQLVQDAKDQLRINNGTAKYVSQLNDVCVLSVNRFADPDFPGIIANAPANIQSEYWSGTIDSDTAAIQAGYKPGTFEVSSTVYQETMIQQWTADWYDVHGPILEGDGVTRRKLKASTTIGGTPQAINTWIFTAITPPAPPSL